MTSLIVAACALAFATLAVSRAVVRVPDHGRVVIERLGHFDRILEPGTHIIAPFVQRVRFRVDMRQQVLDLPPRERRTGDGRVVVASVRLHYRVRDVRAAMYDVPGIANALSQLTSTALGVALEGMDTQAALDGQHALGWQLLSALDEEVRRWGVELDEAEVSVHLDDH